MSFISKFIVCLVLCLGGGWLTGLVTELSVREWYPTLIKPSGTPPNILFPIVWTILYALMALALTLLWQSKTHHKKKAVIFFVIQLLLNFLWSGIFFYLQSPKFALIDLCILWLFIVMTFCSFYPHTRIGAYLLLPYLAWVTYAFYLNLFILILN